MSMFVFDLLDDNKEKIEELYVYYEGNKMKVDIPKSMEDELLEDTDALYCSVRDAKMLWQQYDIACVTAFRKQLAHVTKKTYKDRKIGDTFSYEDNIARNRILKQKLEKYGYRTDDVVGYYIEDNEYGRNDSYEESFFVSNVTNDSQFKERIRELAEYYNQDSFLYISRGGHNGILLVGTNASCIGEERIGNNVHFKVTEEFVRLMNNRDIKDYTQFDDGNMFID